MPNPKKIPLGRPLQLTDEQLDELAAIDATDIELLRAFWRAHAPEGFETLLDARPIEDQEADRGD
jgi:hypothetical protein